MARCCLPQVRRAKRLPRPQWLERSRSLEGADNVSVMSSCADAQGRWEVCFAVESNRRKRLGSIERCCAGGGTAEPRMFQVAGEPTGVPKSWREVRCYHQLMDRSSGYGAVSAEFLAHRGNRSTPSTAIGVKEVRKWARTLPPGSSVIDLGCGPAFRSL